MEKQPDELVGLMARGKDLYRSDRFAEARDVFREALALGERSFGPDALELIEPLKWLANALSEKNYGRLLPECVALHQRMLAIAEARCGPDSMQTSGALYKVSLDLAMSGHREEALAGRRRALEISLRNLDDEHHFVQEVRGALGSMLTEMGRPDEAIPLLLREAEIADKFGYDASRMIAHRSLGLAFRGAHRWAEAVGSFETSIALAEARPIGGGRLAQEMRRWLEEARRAVAAGDR